MTKLLATTAALALMAGGAAHAQEADWSGLYVGAHAGITSNDSSDDETLGFDTNLDGVFTDTVRTAAGANAFSPGFCGGAATSSLPGSGCKEDDEGFEFGARLGYDWQFGGFVMGPVVELSRTNVKDSVAGFSTTPAQYTFERKLKGLAALRLRGGYAFGDNLLYATGGVAQGDVQHSFTTTNTANTFVQRGDDTATGYQFGGGYERKLTPDVTLGLEYLYTNLDDDDFVVRSQGPAAANNPFLLVNASGTDLRRSEDELKFHSFRITASYRF